MNALETMRQALAAVQVAYSLKSDTTNWLTRHIDQWEAWTGHHETRQQKERRERREERLARKYRRPVKEDNWTFYGDRRLFSDSDFEATRLDLFETLSSTWIKKDWVFDKKLGRKKQVYRVQEVDLERIIFKRLIEAEPNDVPQDVEFERKNDLRAQCQLDRMIIEDCTNSSSNRIEIPQLIQTGACNIPAHLRIEDIKKFSPTIKTLEEAQTMSRAIKSLGLGFTDWVMKPVYKPVTLNGKTKHIGLSLSKRINQWAKTKGKKPWMAELGEGGCTLSDIAEELYLMEHQDQEMPEWAEGSENKELMAFFPANWEPPQREDELLSKNMVGEYTYQNVSRIPNGKEFRKFRSKFKPMEFLRAIGRVDEMTNEEIIAFSKEVKKRGNYEQKDRWLAESRRVLNARAREEYTGPITQIPAVLEPVETEGDVQGLFERMDGWQFDEAGHRYMEHQDDPEEDILDDFEDVA